MTRHQLALLIGGLLPAILLGLSGVCQKLSTTAGIGSGPLLIVIGLTSTVVGVLFCADGDWTWTRGGIGYACLFGLCWPPAPAASASPSKNTAPRSANSSRSTT